MLVCSWVLCFQGQLVDNMDNFAFILSFIHYCIITGLCHRHSLRHSDLRSLSVQKTEMNPLLLLLSREQGQRHCSFILHFGTQTPPYVIASKDCILCFVTATSSRWWLGSAVFHSVVHPQELHILLAVFQKQWEPKQP